MERNVRVVESLVYRFEVCKKVYKSSPGMTMHKKQIHRVTEERVGVECTARGMSVEMEGA